MGKLFGTDGVRGLVGTKITPELAFQLGFKGAYVLRKRHGNENSKSKIFIGRDTRISGSMLESALAAGICAAGVDVVSLGVIPTAAVAYMAKNYGGDAGVVISASHNPAEDNGIKFFGGNGYKLPDQVENEIEDLILNNVEIDYATGKDVGVVTYEHKGNDLYGKYLIDAIGGDLKGLKIVIDGANGAASKIAPKVFEELGAELVVISCEPDGWNINDNCGSTHTENLQAAVKAHGANVGIAFDGDADRLQVVDENGELVDGDVIMVICAKALKAQNKLATNTLVVTVMSNMGLRIAMENAGIEVLTTQVGDRYVLEKMLETGANIGGEQSGHIIFGDINTTGDGLTSALYFLQVLKNSQSTVSDLATAMKILPQILVNVRVASKDGWDVNDKITAAIKNGDEILKNRGRILVRPSGTEPLLRVMAEGDDIDELHKIVNDIAEVVKSELA